MKKSAWILPYRVHDGRLQVWLGRLGGPFWRKKKRAWTILKGEVEEGEDLLEAAKREFFEEIGKEIEGVFVDLGEVRAGGKTNHIFAVEAPRLDTRISSNRFKLEWPPRSGRVAEYPEIEEARWFDLGDARKMIVSSLAPFLDRLERIVSQTR